MAQANGGSIPSRGGRSAQVQKRSREESGDVGDADEVRGHCRTLTTKENREAAISMLPDPDPTKVHPCDGCGKDVRELCYVRCAECVHPRAVDICLDCFRQGSEPFQHVKTHAYRVVDRLQAHVYTDDWTAREELSLADHTRTRGMGEEAWEDLAFTDLFFRTKSPSELKTRYLDTYLCRHGSVLPPHHLRRRDDGTMERVSIPLTDPHTCQPALRGVKVSSLEIENRTIAELGTSPVHRYEPSWQAVAKKEEDANAAASANAAVAAGTATTATANAAATAASGFGSKAALGSGSSNGSGGGGGVKEGLGKDRAGATPRATVTAAEREAGGAAAAKAVEAKAPQVSRKKRKVDRDNRNKEEERAIKEWVGGLPGADLAAYDPLRRDFIHEHDNSAELLLADMVFGPTDDPKERQVKLDVIGIYNHRLDEREKRKQFVVEHNLLDSKKQSVASCSKKMPKEDRELRDRLRPLERFSTADEHEELVDSLLLSRKLRVKLAQLEAQRQNGVSTMAEGRELKLDKKVQVKQGGAGASGLGHGGSANVLDVTGATGLEFLSQPEILLCSRLHMLPKYYLAVKMELLQEYARAGFLKKTDLPNLSVMDVGRLNQIYDFCVCCGWVKDQSSSGGS